MSTAEYQRAWRAKHGAATGRPGRPPAPCGTAAAYKRHIRLGEAVDAACRAAYNAEQREFARRRRSGRGQQRGWFT